MGTGTPCKQAHRGLSSLSVLHTHVNRQVVPPGWLSLDLRPRSCAPICTRPCCRGTGWGGQRKWLWAPFLVSELPPLVFVPDAWAPSFVCQFFPLREALFLLSSHVKTTSLRDGFHIQPLVVSSLSAQGSLMHTPCGQSWGACWFPAQKPAAASSSPALGPSARDPALRPSPPQASCFVRR